MKRKNSKRRLPLISLFSIFAEAEGFSRIYLTRTFALLFVTFIIAVGGMSALANVLSTPGGLPAIITHAMILLCQAGAPDCSFEYLYGVVASTIFIATMITTVLILNVHMVLHLRDLSQKDLQVLDTLTAKNAADLENLQNQVHDM